MDEASRISGEVTNGRRRESTLLVSDSGSIVQLTGGDSSRSDATVTVVAPATVVVTDRRIVAAAGANEWSWPLADLVSVTHGREQLWSILAVPDVPDHGVAVGPEDVDAFRSTLDGLVSDGDLIGRSDSALRSLEPPPPPEIVVPDLDRHMPQPPPPPVDRNGTSGSSSSSSSSSERRPTFVGQAPDNPDLVGLEARDVSAWFGSHHVLDRVSLVMEPGQVTALIGPSGCGKSTFLRILNRMHEMIPSASLAGEVLLDDVDIYDPQRRVTDARRQIGMVFQKPNPFPAMSIYDNVVASFRLTGTKVSNDERDAVVEGTLTKAGLWNEVKDRLRQPGGGLSGGQQQRLCIARALAIRPRVLLMDEPCSALDPTSTRRIEQTIQELADEVTIVIVTHNMQQAARVSHRCAFFLAEQGTPGVIVEHGPTEAMFASPQDTRTSDYVTGRFG